MSVGAQDIARLKEAAAQATDHPFTPAPVAVFVARLVAIVEAMAAELETMRKEAPNGG